MPITPPDIRATIRSILKRLDALERRLANLARFKRIVDIPFSYEGGLDGGESPYYYPAEPGGVVVEILASLKTAGTTATTIELRRNGNEVATITFAAGETLKIDKTVRVDFAGNQDRMTVAITVAGAGAADLNVQVRLKVDAG